MIKLLHILSQRPGRSGSGVFLKSMIHEAARRGYQQHVVAAGPSTTSYHEVPPLGEEAFTGIFFPSVDAPFDVPGNSDVMPYPSTVFSAMSARQITQYLNHTENVLKAASRRFKPDIVHSHHLWMMTAKARAVFHGVPMIATAHNVGLRLGVKSPHLMPYVKSGIQQIDRICVLTPKSLEQTREFYGVSQRRLEITGAGYRGDYFFPAAENRKPLLKREFGIDLPDQPIVCCIGRLSTAKGIPFILKAVEKLKGKIPFKLLLVGAVGSGEDGAAIARQLETLGDQVICTGAVSEQAVAEILRCVDVFALPSLFEGLPLVMLEAVASGCPCLISRLPTIESWVPAEWANSGLFQFVDALDTIDADVPVKSDTSRYVADLAVGITQMLAKPISRQQRLAFADNVVDHTWSRVFDRYQRVYADLLDNRVSHAM